MKKFFVYFFLILMITTISVISIKFIKDESKYKESDTIYCITENQEQNEKLEIYFDFKDKKVYRFSIIGTQNYSDSINIDRYIKSIDNTNKKYVGSLGKIWYDNKKFITIETYHLDILSEEEFKQLTGMSKKEIQATNRQELIDLIIPIGETSNYSCK